MHKFADYNNSVKSQIIFTNSVKSDNTECQREGTANLGVQQLQLREVAELWWDSASELIGREEPARATMNQ